VPVREEPAPAEPAPVASDLGSPAGPAQVPTARPYPDSQAEELDVPDFLK
jgi:cell division protein FtsZ